METIFPYFFGAFIVLLIIFMLIRKRRHHDGPPLHQLADEAALFIEDFRTIAGGIHTPQQLNRFVHENSIRISRYMTVPGFQEKYRKIYQEITQRFE